MSEKKNITIANDENIKVMNDASTEINQSTPVNQNITTTNHSEIFVNNSSENVWDKLFTTDNKDVLQSSLELEDILDADDPKLSKPLVLDGHPLRMKSESQDSETVILNDLSNNEWSVLSGDLNLDILPLEQDLRGEVVDDMEHKHVKKYIKVNCARYNKYSYYEYLQDNESVIIITSCVMIAVLLVSIIALLTGRLLKIFLTSPSQALESDSSYQGYPSVIPEPILFSNHSPVYGTVGRRARPGSSDQRQRYSQAEMLSYLQHLDTRHSDNQNNSDSYLYQ